jgi:ankyrin repeat protein
LEGLYRRFTNSQRASQAIPAESLLTTALHFTLKQLDEVEQPQHIVRELLAVSANKGNYVACALAAKLSQVSDDNGDDMELMGWLKTAVSTGCLNSRVDLFRLNHKVANEALRSFQHRGGYNMYYWSQKTTPDMPIISNPQGTEEFHRLAAFGTPESLSLYLANHPGVDINAISERQETALYLACTRGSWEHMATLLGKGADPSIACTASRITCLHWVMTFDTTVLELAVRRLVQKGADVNAQIPSNLETPFPHYPFVLPAGTPLHWAVTTSRHCAVKALVGAGANPVLRNNSDPYMYDDRIRHLNAVGGPDGEGCTFPKSDCFGLSSLDIAAIHRDPFLFRLLVENNERIDINSTDEEGFTVLHRLATSQVFRTSRRIRYSPQSFRNANDVKELHSMVTDIIRLGGKLETLTSDVETLTLRKSRPTDLFKSSYTPLMLAVLEGDCNLIEALLDCGACVNTVNSFGHTALLQVSHRASSEQPDIIRCMQTLLSHDADVHHHSFDGRSALLSAAHGQVLDVFRFLLSQGASIDERDNTPRTAAPGKSVFAYFAATKDNADEAMVGLLTDNVLRSPDKLKVKSVLHGTAVNGSTLLHAFAASAMPKSVELLLHRGAQVDVLQRQTRFCMRDGVQAKRVWFETPLDGLEVAEKFSLERMLSRNDSSPDQSRALRARWDKTREILKAHGGYVWNGPETYEVWP